MRNLATPLVRKRRAPLRLMPSKSGLITGINAFRRHLLPRAPQLVGSRTRSSPFRSRPRVAGWWDDQPRDDDDRRRDDAAGREYSGEREPRQTLQRSDPERGDSVSQLIKC